MDDYWFSPKNLEKSRVEYESADPASMIKEGDFSCYAKVNRGAGLVGSGIENHNLINPLIRVRLYKRILGSRPRFMVADIGCGLGFSSKALGDIFSANVDGYEISLDAVQFAKEKWPDLWFYCRAVEPGVPLNSMYDLIVAQEFYPFTRTADLDIHLGYINELQNSLNSGGVLLIGLSEGTKGSVLSNITELKGRLKYENINISLKRLPFDQIYKVIPFFWVANFLSWILSILMRRPRFCVLLIHRVEPSSA